ncbi:MAG: TonB-dependent receptor, partial [Proteobacteria bacterium]|nr:TonB-dependent receptor [Pseudomonadota bacterium]
MISTACLSAMIACGTPINSAAATDQMVVTGTREAEPLFNQPESIGVVTGDAIREAHVTHPSEILERIPGVHQAWLGGDHHTTVIRQPINFNPLYLTLENGVPTRATGFFETNALYDVNLPQAAGTEITKGPGTALYGSDAIAGVINVLTPLPPEEPFAGSISVEGSSRGYKRALISVGGTDGAHGLRGDFNLTHDDGWRDNTQSERYMGTLTWAIDNGGALKVRNVLMLATINQESTGSNLNPDDFANNPKRNTQPIAFRNVDSVRFQSHISYDMGDALLTAVPYFRYSRIELLPSFALGFDPHFFDTKATSIGGQLKYRQNFAEDFRLIVGVDVDYTTGSRVDRSLSLTRADGIITDFTEVATVYDFDVDAITLSPYMHGEWQATSRLRIVAGVRFDYARYDYTNDLTTVLDPTALHNRPADQNQSFDSFSPKAGLTYNVTDNLNAFFSYKRGFRIPTASQLYRPGRSTLSTELQPVKADSFEVGARGAWERIQFEISLYTMKINDDILVFTNDDTGVRDIRNSGDTRHKGIEIGFAADITDTVAFSGAYARNSHEFIEWAPVSGADLSGNKINRAPKDIGNARVTWRPEFLNGGRFEIEYQHLGGYFLDDNNTRTYGGHDLLNLSANMFISDGIEVFLRVHNVTNTRYSTNGRFNAFAGEELKPGLARAVFG